VIGIITDSTCDIPEELIEQYGIVVVPALVIWGEEEYRDRVEIKPQEFYRRLAAGTGLPHSAMPRVPDFQAAYQSLIQRGAEAILVLTVSSAMSGTYQLARNVAKEFPIAIEVIDSKGPTMSLGWQVLAAARAREAGADLKRIIEYVTSVRERLVQIVGMQTLKYLQAGGRIGNAARWAGTLLQVKPVISINHHTGLVEPAGIARTRQAMINMMYKKFFHQIGSHKNLRIAVLHGNTLEAAQSLADRIKAEFNPLELLINITGPVLGINTGPDALALCGYADEA